MADNFRLYRSKHHVYYARRITPRGSQRFFHPSNADFFLDGRENFLSFSLSLTYLLSFFLFLQRYFQICFHKSTRCLVISICTRKIENSSSLQIPLTLSFELSIRFLVKWRGRSSIHERKEKLNLRYTILRILYKSPTNKPSPAFLTNCN